MTTGKNVYARSLFLIRCSVNGFRLRCFLWIGIARGIVEKRRYAALYCMRCCLCVKLQPREILPGLPEAYHPETGCRAYAEKTRPYYAIEGKTAPFTGRSGRVSCMGKGLIPNPVKSEVYCVTVFITAKQKGHRSQSVSVPAIFSNTPNNQEGL